jgi:dTDP-4-dehydrorhamnose 3,5-epimerase
MLIEKAELKGIYIVIPEPFMDERGFFMRTYDDRVFDKYGISRKWVQENHSRSEKRGIIRGLHFQMPPFTETKLVRCIKGAIQDVFVDLRKNSSTIGKWHSIELSEENKKMVLIPKGFAHGFCTLTEESEVLYKVDNYYNKDMERGIIWNDKDLNIYWQVDKPILSEKDEYNQTFKDFISKTGGI